MLSVRGVMLLFCPSCANLLVLSAGNTFTCKTCPYVHHLPHTVSRQIGSVWVLCGRQLMLQVAPGCRGAHPCYLWPSSVLVAELRCVLRGLVTPPATTIAPTAPHTPRPNPTCT